MTTVIAKLHKGSKLDPVIILIGILIVIFGILTLYETNFWKSSKVLWQPIILLGGITLVANKFSQKFRSSLNINLVTNNDHSIIIEPIKKIIFSGWVVESAIEIEKNNIKTIKIFDFPEGLYWVYFELNNRSIIKFGLSSYQTIEEIIYFVKNNIQEAELIVNENIKI